MAEVTIPSGLLESSINALGGFEGKKSISLAVQISRTQSTIKEFLLAWQTEHLVVAIKEFTKGKTSVPQNRVAKFLEKYEDVYAMEVTIEVTPLVLKQLKEEKLLIHEDDIGVLLRYGLVTDD